MKKRTIFEIIQFFECNVEARKDGVLLIDTKGVTALGFITDKLLNENMGSREKRGKKA